MKTTRWIADHRVIFHLPGTGHALPENLAPKALAGGVNGRITTAAARIAYGLDARRQGFAPFKERSRIVLDRLWNGHSGFSARRIGNPHIASILIKLVR